MQLSTGSRLGSYEIISPLGSGGMGELYRARDPRLDRLVAIKVLPGTMLGDPERRERFEREARAVAALNHPGIVTIYSVEQDASVPFLTMELVEGRTLAAAIPPRGMPLDRFLQVAIPLCDAVAAAHEKGIIHRDLKPANVMVTDSGRVKVLDFGLAKLKEASESAAGLTMLPSGPLTGDGRIVGTVAYMSPEQAEGRPVDHRSDIFSLGILLYEMATAQRPFKGDNNMSLLTSIIRDTPVSVTEIRDEAPRELSRIIRRCLEKDPARRAQSALDVRNELEDLRTELTQETGRARERPPSSSGTMAAVPRRSRLTVLLTASAVAVALVGLASAWWWTHRAAPAPVNAPNRLAVAAFENRTGDPSFDSLGLLTADTLTQGLTQVGVAEVAPTGTAPAAGVSAADQLQAIATKTGATLAVIGAYYLQGNNLQVQARVMDARQNRLVHAIDPISGPRADPNAVVEQLKQRVMGFIAMYFDPAWDVQLMSHVPTYDAYREYTAGFDLFGADYGEAIRHYERASELDPGFMWPQLMVATSYSNQGEYARMQPVLERLLANRDRYSEYERLILDWFGAAREGNDLRGLEYLRKSEKMDPRSIAVNYLIGLYQFRLNRPQETVETFRRRPLVDRELRYRVNTWRYNPLTQALHILGRFEEERQAGVEAQRALPDSIPYRGHTARALVGLNKLDELGRFIDETLARPGASTAAGGFLTDLATELRAHGHRDEASRLAARAVDWYRGRPADVANRPASRFSLTSVLVLAGQADEATAILTTLVKEVPDNVGYKGALGVAAARAGDRTTAMRISDELGAVNRPFLYGSHTYWRASIAAALGEKDRAVDLLRESSSQGRSYSITVHRDVNLESLRGHASFDELIRPKG